MGASTELETCMACHSRRKMIAKSPVPGAPYLDAYLPALLEPGRYHADGQIDEPLVRMTVPRALPGTPPRDHSSHARSWFSMEILKSVLW